MVNFDVVKLILDHLQKPHSLILFVTDRLGHDRRYAIDSSFALRELNWKPRREFREGLQSTIDWYLNNRTWWEALLERRQILSGRDAPATWESGLRAANFFEVVARLSNQLQSPEFELLTA
ncbi:MAG: hypothetical protein ABR526_13450 [Chthoniobacterales bacterium]